MTRGFVPRHMPSAANYFKGTVVSLVSDDKVTPEQAENAAVVCQLAADLHVQGISQAAGNVATAAIVDEGSRSVEFTLAGSAFNTGLTLIEQIRGHLFSDVGATHEEILEAYLEGAQLIREALATMPQAGN